MSTSRALLISLESLQPGYGDVVLSAAFGLLDETQELVIELAGVREVTAEVGQQLEARLPELCAGPIRAGVNLIGAGERAALGEVEVVSVGQTVASALQGVLRVVSFAQGRRRAAEESAEQDVHAIRDALIAQRHAAQRHSVARPVVAVVGQVQSTWGAAEPVYRELQVSGQVDLVVVAVPSEHEMTSQPTPEFFADYGAQVRDVDWLSRQLDDPSSRLSGVIFYDPWDEFRPSPARAVDVANAGVPVFYFPYANSLGVGDGAEQAVYDMPVHRVATGVFVVDEYQRKMFERHCSSGASSVRVTGSPKMDRLRPLRRQVEHAAACTFLWNPHFRVGLNGWSTALDYCEPLISFFEGRQDLRLIVRPHFRIARDFPELGGEYAACWVRMKNVNSSNITLDLSSDYVESFDASDALLSDYSSLIHEYAQLDKPILRLGNGRSVALPSEGGLFGELESADMWSHIQSFIEDCSRDVAPHAEIVAAARRRHFPMQDGNSARRAASVILDAILAGQGGAVA